MNSFALASSVEAEAWEVLRPYLHMKSEGRYVLTNKGTLARWLQESVGDVLLNTSNGTLYAVELKAERKHTGNLFLEEWSNRNLDDKTRHADRGSNPGWLLKIRADLLLYYFIDADVLYSIDVFSLKRWAFGHGTTQGRLHSFRQVTQSKYEQANDTVGRLVPVKTLIDELPKGAIRHAYLKEKMQYMEAA